MTSPLSPGAIGPGAALGHDQLNVTALVSLGGSTLSLSGGYVPNQSTLDSFKIINNDGSDLVTCTINSLPEGSPISFGTGTLYITYNGDAGSNNNDVVLNSQPIVNGTPGADTLVLRQVSGDPTRDWLSELSLGG